MSVNNWIITKELKLHKIIKSYNTLSMKYVLYHTIISNHLTANLAYVHIWYYTDIIV